VALGPEAAAAPADSAFAGAIQSYQGFKKLAMEPNSQGKIKFDERDASIQATCLIGVRVSTGFQLGNQDSAEMVGDSLPICSGAAIGYKLAALGNISFDDSPHDLSKAPDESTRNLWHSEDVATDIKQCTDRGPNYAGLLACSCVAGARVGAAKAIPTGDERAKQSLMERSNTVCQRLSAKFAELDGPDAAKKDQEFRSLIETVKIERANKAGDYATAYTLSQQKAAATEAEEVKETGKAAKRSADALSGLSWHALFAQKFSEALTAAERSITLDPPNLVPQTNRAHALMMLGRTAEAKTLYLANKGKPLQDKTWDWYIADDFAKLRKAGITHPMMSEIETALKDPASPPAGLPIWCAKFLCVP
jgi:hypothetical protein